MKLAVTTASGHLGSEVISCLKPEVGPDNIVGIARTPQNAQHLGVEIRKGDYNNKKDFDAALKGVDAVLLVSGMDHPDVRIAQHRNVIYAARENGVKKIVYTSIIGSEKGNAFSPVVASNRQTEKDIIDSGMEWAIGRNGLYIEPDLEYIDNYIKEGGIFNCAGDGSCSYTSRTELAYAYFNMLTKENLKGKVYNLAGEPVTQKQLADAINNAYATDLVYKSISVEEYIRERKSALGDFMGTIIGGIYEGIRQGEFDIISDYEELAGRKHKSLVEMIKEFKTVSDA